MRSTAVHALCSEIVGGSFVRGSAETGEASFVENLGEKFSRVCVVGKVVDKSFSEAGEATAIIEDDSGQLPAVAETQGAQKALQLVNKGELLLLIGKLRERQERFVAAEVARRLFQQEWLQLHLKRAELRKVSRVKEIG